jgi:hypothetical protein
MEWNGCRRKVLAEFEVLSEHSLVGTEENYETYNVLPKHWYPATVYIQVVMILKTTV